MIRSKSLYLLLMLLIGNAALAQNSASTTGINDFPVFSCGNDTVNSEEFLRVFNKNRRSDAAPTQQEIEEYLDLYVRFKLKVTEAYARQMDTSPQFIRELAGYRSQLAQPYLTDKTVTEKLIQEAYDRSRLEVRASHLMVKCDLNASPKDTLVAYNRIMGYRSRIVDNNEEFNTMAASFSEDESAKVNNGDLGYFTVFQMIYPFESVAYSLEPGQVSMPVRTMFGYHLVYLQDKRPALGDVKVAHLMIKFYNDAQIDSTKRRIDAVHQQLLEGANWEQLVEEFSEDFSTNSKGGELNWFNRTTSNVPEEFKEVAYELKGEGTYSEPFRTRFGWHIVKLLATRPLPEFDLAKDGLRRKVERDSRSEKNKDIVVKRFMKENNFREIKGVDAVAGKISADLLQGMFVRPQDTQAVLFMIGDRAYTDSMFYDYLAQKKGVIKMDIDAAVKAFYGQYVNVSNMAYEEEHLEQKHAEFRNVMKEYKDGILLFDLNDQEVWSKAVSDTAGLKAFYTANQDKYRWAERAEVVVYSCKDKKIAKKAKKLAKHGTTPADIVATLNKKDALNISAEPKLVEKGDHALLDNIEWATGIYDLGEQNDRVKFAQIKKIVPPSDKPLKKNMGQATSDYQNYLEQKWIEELRSKYQIHIFEENVKKLY